MFNNLVNLHDFVVLAERLREAGGMRLARKFLRSRSGRVQAAWQATESRTSNWWEIPAVERRWNGLITGDAELSPTAYVAARYIPGAVRAVSLGCGAGTRERAWVREAGGMTLAGYDLSRERIAAAADRAQAEGLADRLRFHVADVQALELPPGSIDVAITEGALHHFAPVRRVLDAIHSWLVPGGLLVVNEYVGPSRFQWTDRQLDLVERLLAAMPGHLRTTYQGHVKQRAYRPGRLSMYLNDPSEAAESSAIMPALHERFEIVELKEYGGTLLQLLFKDIAHHFIDPAPESDAAAWLERAFAEEDRALRAGEITSDFVYVVARKG